ncbi:CobW family GTP-binding protein [Aestuariivita sp.]|jgi:G3E family GTPase|uniref:CobW family GTP-binding protein n=1 Tax=Aestuariivita sp. TaxID=1872407 RepID=UPI00216F78D4|nr:CobW family GTP-binding protein [Aestuariivita sp.]MCE8006960.1 GTP-binding protein [Aestuariivita sp.]
MTPLPVTVIAGYLGAGKTTLINRLLAENHGLRLMVIVNDFGAINIDADLLNSHTDDTIALTNGCICCTMGDDLHRALDTALDRRPRPDHLIIEASGIADPTVIANAAIAEPDLSYAGIVTLVDGLNLPDLVDDPQIAPQIRRQIATADLVLATKVGALTQALSDILTKLEARTPQLLGDTALAPLLFGLTPLPKGRSDGPHPAYTTWHHHSDHPCSRAELAEKLENRPQGLYRFKGLILTDDGGYEVHIVGRYVSARRVRTDSTRLVALGPASRITPDQIEAWWQA